MELAVLGVVPVFVNAGAALLPAILAGLATIASLVVRPRELFRASATRPRVTAAILASLLGLCGGITWWVLGPGQPDAARRKPGDQQTHSALAMPGGARIDWAAKAIEWLRQEKIAAAGEVAVEKPSQNPGRDVTPPGDRTGSAAGSKTERPGNEPASPFIYGGGPLRSGYVGGGSPVGLTAAWEFPAAGSKLAEELEGAMFLDSPAVVGNTVYGGSCLLDFVRNYGTLFCLDAKTGTPRWTLSSYRDEAGKEVDFKGFFSSPAVTADGNYLVIGQGLHTDDDCELVCVHAKTGRLHWRQKTPLHIEGSPAIEGDLAVVGAGAIEVGDDHKAKGHSGLVVAVKISTGQKLWEHPLNDPESSPVVGGGIVYIGSGFHGNAVVALRTETDEELKKNGVERLLWQSPTPHPATGAVTLVEDLVLIGCGNGDYVFADPNPDGAVIALDRKTGQKRWAAAMPDGVLGKIAVCDGRAMVPVRNGEIVAIDLKASGKILWRQRISGQKAVLAGAAFTGKYTYAVSQDGYLAVLDATDGKVLEKHYLNAKGKPGEMGLCVSSPTVAGGRVFVGSETGGLRGFFGKEIKQ